MCELLGLSAERETEAQELLLEFFAHSVQHPHGYGLMRHRFGKREIYREAAPAWKSARLPHLIETAPPQKTLLAHIRLATIGSPRLPNCHPFGGVDNSGRT